MMHIIAGTNRENSKTMMVAGIIKRLYEQEKQSIDIIDISQVRTEITENHNYESGFSTELSTTINKVNTSDGLIMVVPEYNGSYPGILKYFIDHWQYPLAFEYRPVCFVGLGGKFGGLRPVEHLQQVFNYRNAFVFPLRVFLFNVWNQLKNGEITEKLSQELMLQQTQGFIKFVTALKNSKLDANSVNALNNRV